MTTLPQVSVPSASLLDLPVAIFGAGVVGRAVRGQLVRLGVDYSVVYDAKKAPGITFTANAALRHALVVYSADFAPDHPWLRLARAAGCVCLDESEFGRLIASAPSRARVRSARSDLVGFPSAF
jgi:UDP-N-acetylmuramoylalanine--D-glutamate ligase